MDLTIIVLFMVFALTIIVLASGRNELASVAIKGLVGAIQRALNLFQR